MKENSETIHWFVQVHVNLWETKPPLMFFFSWRLTWFAATFLGLFIFSSTVLPTFNRRQICQILHARQRISPSRKQITIFFSTLKKFQTFRNRVLRLRNMPFGNTASPSSVVSFVVRAASPATNLVSSSTFLPRLWQWWRKEGEKIEHGEKKREKEGGKEVCLALSRKTIIAGKKNFPCFPLSPNWLGRGNKAEGRERGRERSKDKSWFWGIRTLREKEREREREKRQCIMVLQNVES